MVVLNSNSSSSSSSSVGNFGFFLWHVPMQFAITLPAYVRFVVLAVVFSNMTPCR